MNSGEQGQNPFGQPGPISSGPVSGASPAPNNTRRYTTSRRYSGQRRGTSTETSGFQAAQRIAADPNTPKFFAQAAIDNSFSTPAAPKRKRSLMPVFILLGALILVVVVIVVVFLTPMPEQGGGGGGTIAGPQDNRKKISLNSQKYILFKNYLYFGIAEKEDKKTTMTADRIYFRDLINKDENFTSEKGNNYNYVAEVDRLYKDLIDGVKDEDNILGEYNSMMAILEKYINPVPYYKNVISRVNYNTEAKKITDKMASLFPEEITDPTWSLAKAKLNNYILKSVKLYQVYDKYRCLNHNNFNPSCMQAKNQDVLREFNKAQSSFQGAAQELYSEASQKEVAEAVIKAIEKLGEYAK